MELRATLSFSALRKLHTGEDDVKNDGNTDTGADSEKAMGFVVVVVALVELVVMVLILKMATMTKRYR